MLDPFQGLKDHERGQIEWAQAERVKEAGCGVWRAFLPGLYPMGSESTMNSLHHSHPSSTVLSLCGIT